MAKTTPRPRTANTAAARPVAAAPAAPAPAAPARPAAPEPVRRQVLKVRATRVGFYDNRRLREGDVFVLAKKEDFSAAWMEPVATSVREHVTSAPEALKKQHDELLREKYVPTGTPQVSDEDGATGDENPLLA